VPAALVAQHAKRISRIILSSVACTVILYFSTLSHKQLDFRGVIERKICVFIFSTFLSEAFLILRRNERDMIKMCIGLHVKHFSF